MPDWWTVGDTECLLPVEDTVYVESGAMTDCASSVPEDTYREVSSLAVIATGSAHGRAVLDGLTRDGAVDGKTVLTGEECRWFGQSACRTVVAVPDRGVAFALYVADPGDVDPAAIRESLRVLPEGWSTVPLSLGEVGRTPTWGDRPAVVRDYTEVLERRGFSVRTQEAETARGDHTLHVAEHVADLPAGSLLDIEPSPGSPIADGGAVVLTVMPAVAR